METEKIQAFIRKIELFKGLNAIDQRILCKNITVDTLKKGSHLFYENAPRKAIFIIHSGKVDLYKTTLQNKKTKLATFTTYDFLGEGSLLDDSPHSTTALCTTDTVVFRLAREFFQSHGNIAYVVMSHIARIISKRMSLSNLRAGDVSAQYVSGRTRKEHDLLGHRDVPYEYYYGIQTLRALENFHATGIPISFFPDLIVSLAIIKMASAKTNARLQLLDPNIEKAIIVACREIINGRYHNQFVVDMIQGGAGTSTNMNANEVIANRALEILGYEKGDYQHCHPNNHVNLSQSTNDAYPSAVHLALIFSNEKLIVVLKELISALEKKAQEFSKLIKMGRTQLQDAVPMTMGQTFKSFASTLEDEVERLEENARLFLELNMGGTAIGTGINADPKFGEICIGFIKEVSGLPVFLADDLVEATQDTGAFVMYSSAIKRLAVKLSKISNDLRLLSSGPRAGINEINLPPVQPGSSIMPGKVNPVIPEFVNQIAFKVIGNDLTVTLAAEAGQLELNVMEPVIVQSIFESMEMLKNGMRTLMDKCIYDIKANEDICRKHVENSIGLVTALNPFIGYEASSRIAKRALEENKSVYELVLEEKLLSKEKLEKILNPENMVRPKNKNS